VRQFATSYLKQSICAFHKGLAAKIQEKPQIAGKNPPQKPPAGRMSLPCPRRRQNRRPAAKSRAAALGGHSASLPPAVKTRPASIYRQCRRGNLHCRL